MCVASAPIAIDFSCGFQPNLSCGTRSNVLRVFAISLSNSGSNDSLTILFLHIGCLQFSDARLPNLLCDVDPLIARLVKESEQFQTLALETCPYASPLPARRKT